MGSSEKLSLYILGTGLMAETLVPAICLAKVNILAFIDERPQAQGTTFFSRQVIGPERLDPAQCDYVLIVCHGAEQVACRLSTQNAIPASKLVPFDLTSLTETRSAARVHQWDDLRCAFELHASRWPGLLEALDMDILLRRPLFRNYVEHTPVNADTHDKLLGKLMNRFLREELQKAADLLVRNGYYPAFAGEMTDKLVSSTPRLGDYVRYATLSALAHEITSRNIPGCIAELGVFRGEFATAIARLFPERPFYLFDTFEGFSSEQLNKDRERFQTEVGRHGNTSIELVRKKLSFHKHCIFKQGFFPDTAYEGGKELDLSFAFVSLDVDIYQSTLDGLKYFHPRLAQGGYILVHDYGHPETGGCKQAVLEFCEKNGVPHIPVADFALSAILPARY